MNGEDRPCFRSCDEPPITFVARMLETVSGRQHHFWDEPDDTTIAGCQVRLKPDTTAAFVVGVVVVPMRRPVAAIALKSAYTSGKSDR